MPELLDAGHHQAVQAMHQEFFDDWIPELKAAYNVRVIGA